ncbi:MAG: GSCFA domain-containing protein [Cyclobacteriaceae bacterium]|nr:GSCFA domain-containing protein [Cyclobacteriaceae bacterium]
MSAFRTIANVNQSPELINIKDGVLTVGSCFADAMGEKFIQHKFTVLKNPFGTTYNPLSIHTQLAYAIHNQLPAQHTFLENNDVHLNYNFHSSLSDLSQPALEKIVAETIGKAHYFLKNTNWLMITYGTAWMYTRKDTGEVVANCHKIPATEFEKELCTQKRMLDSFEDVYSKLKSFNPNLNIILTVSPVRHLKDTLELNSVSKSVLRLACHTLTQQHKDVHYFPAYEIMLDDLRDYRFYKTDMIHPSEDAETYIWNKFSDAYVDAPTQDFIQQWQSIRLALQHKPFHPTSAAHQAFLKNTLAQLESVSNIVNVDKEINGIKSAIQVTNKS